MVLTNFDFDTVAGSEPLGGGVACGQFQNLIREFAGRDLVSGRSHSVSNVVRNFDDAALSDPENVDVESHVLHPEAVEFRRFVEEEHSMAPGQGVALSQSKRLFLRCDGEFQGDRLTLNARPGRGRGTCRRGLGVVQAATEKAQSTPQKSEEPLSLTREPGHSSPGGA